MGTAKNAISHDRRSLSKSTARPLIDVFDSRRSTLQLNEPSIEESAARSPEREDPLLLKNKIQVATG